MNMDVLTQEQCDAIINQSHDWETVSVVKQKGGTLNFKTADIVVRREKYFNVLKECVMKYDVGDYCTEHTDNAWYMINPNYEAHAVWITPLNDDYEGGELYFDGQLVEQQIGVPVKHLRTTPHEVKPITQGTRYALVSWFFKEKSNDKDNA